MIEPVIECPHCHKEIKLTESLAAPLVEATRLEFETKLAEKDTEVARRETELRDREQSLATARQQVDAQIEAGVRREKADDRGRGIAEGAQLVSDELQGKTRELADLEAVVKAKDEKLADAQKAQAELIRKQRELDDAKRELDLTVETRVQESLGAVRDKAKHDAEEELKLKISEREETIASMQRQIEVLKQKAEQGSQQLQGEVQEMELESLLARSFPQILSSPCPKESSAETSSTKYSPPPGNSAGRFFGNRNEPRTGATAGSGSCAMTSGQQEPILRFWSLVRCPKEVRRVRLHRWRLGRRTALRGSGRDRPAAVVDRGWHRCARQIWDRAPRWGWSTNT